jgi:hypothetical protein
VSSPDDANINLLWTGGWDSTFQLLRIVLIHRARVTPYYLRDRTRPSTEMEILTMERIKARLFSEHPHTRRLIQPTRYFGVADLALDRAITAAFNRTRRNKFMGSQYDWLARFCKQHAITDMELCIHRDDKAHAVVEHCIREDRSAAGYRTWRIDPAYRRSREYAVFGRFAFPLVDLSKLQMASLAEELGWNGFMHMTWFCHRPRRNLQPCGRCPPCLYAIEEGLGWRIPIESRMTSALYRAFVQPLRAPAKAIVRRFKRGDTRRSA